MFLSTAYKWTANWATAEDCYQAAMMKVVFYSGNLPTEGDVTRFMYRVLRNECIDETRRWGNRAAELPVQLPAREGGDIDRKLDAETLLRLLPDRSHRVLRARHFDGLSDRETAREFRLSSESNVAVIANRARRTIREHLRRHTSLE